MTNRLVNCLILIQNEKLQPLRHHLTYRIQKVQLNPSYISHLHFLQRYLLIFTNIPYTNKILLIFTNISLFTNIPVDEIIDICVYSSNNNNENTSKIQNPANIYLFKVNNISTRKRSEIFSKLTIKTPERRRWRRSGVFIANFENISHLFLMLLLLNLSK